MNRRLCNLQQLSRVEYIILHVILVLFEPERLQSAPRQHLLMTALLRCLTLLSSPLLSPSVLKRRDTRNKCVKQQRGRWLSTRQISTFSGDQRAGEHSDWSQWQEDDGEKYGNILKITCSSFSYNNRFWYFCLHSIWWLVSTSSSLLSMNILTPKLVKVACWTHWLTEQKAAGASKTITESTGVSFPPFIPFMVFSTVCLTTNSICGIWLRYLLYLKLL